MIRKLFILFLICNNAYSAQQMLNRGTYLNDPNAESLYSAITKINTNFTYLFQFSTNFYNVKDFGAVGDGVTDDTTAIQAALNAVASTNYLANTNYKSIFFPAGTYRVQPLYLHTVIGARIYGEGTFNRGRQAGSCLVPYTNQSHILKIGYNNRDGNANPFIANSGQNLSAGIMVENLQFSGGGLTVTNLLYLDACAGMNFRNLHFTRNNGRAVTEKNCWEMYWDTINIDYCGTWSDCVWKFEDIYTFGGDTSAHFHRGFNLEANKGKIFFADDNATMSSMHFYDMEYEWGDLTQTNYVAFEGADSGHAIFQMNNIVNSDFSRIVFNNPGLFYDTATNTHLTGFYFHGYADNVKVSDILVGTSSNFKVIKTDINTLYTNAAAGIVANNISTLSTATNVLYSIEGKQSCRLEPINYAILSSYWTKTNSFGYAYPEKKSVSPYSMFGRFISATELGYYQFANATYFVKDTNALSVSRSVLYANTNGLSDLFALQCDFLNSYKGGFDIIVRARLGTVTNIGTTNYYGTNAFRLMTFSKTSSNLVESYILPQESLVTTNNYETNYVLLTYKINKDHINLDTHNVVGLWYTRYNIVHNSWIDGMIIRPTEAGNTFFVSDASVEARSQYGSMFNLISIDDPSKSAQIVFKRNSTGFAPNIGLTGGIDALRYINSYGHYFDSFINATNGYNVGASNGVTTNIVVGTNTFNIVGGIITGVSY